MGGGGRRPAIATRTTMHLADRLLLGYLVIVTVCLATACGQPAPHPNARPTPVSRKPSPATTADPRPAETKRPSPGCPPATERTIRLPDKGAPGGMRFAVVLTPHVHDPSELPVIYWLHGYPGGGDNLINTPTGAAFDAQICAGSRPFILVGPDGNATHHSDTEWADAADGSSDIESFITSKLIAAVEGPHPRPASMRAVVGFSMGGYGAADLALRHPTLFRQFVSITGYYDIDDPSGIFGKLMGPAQLENQRAHEPLLLTRNAADMRVLLISSARDHEKIDQGQDARFAPLLRLNGAFVATLLSPLPHTYALVKSVISTVVQFLESGWYGAG